MSIKDSVRHRDAFSDFIPDERQTVSDEPRHRRANRNLNVLLATGSRSDSAHHRSTGNSRFKGISNRTMAMVSAMNSGSSSSGSGSGSGGSASGTGSVTSQTTSSTVSREDAFGNFESYRQSGTRSHRQSARPAAVPGDQVAMSTSLPAMLDVSRERDLSGSKSSKKAPRSGEPPLPPPHSDPSASKLKIFNKLHPDFALDALACESKDSEEEVRVRDLQMQSALALSSGVPKVDADLGVFSPAEHQVVKVFLVGDPGVGKSSLIQQYFDHTCPANPQPTEGVDFKGRVMRLEDESEYKLQVWDSGGSSANRNILKSYFMKAHAFAIVYDTTAYSSVETIPTWIEIVRSEVIGHLLAAYTDGRVTLDNLYGSPNADPARATEAATAQVDPELLALAQAVPIILVGNKAESSNKVVNSDVMENYARDSGLCGYFEVSAHQNLNVDVVMEVLGGLAYQRLLQLQDYSLAYRRADSMTAATTRTASTVVGLSKDTSGGHRNMGLVPDAHGSSYASLDVYLGPDGKDELGRDRSVGGSPYGSSRRNSFSPGIAFEETLDASEPLPSSPAEVEGTAPAADPAPAPAHPSILDSIQVAAPASASAPAAATRQSSGSSKPSTPTASSTASKSDSPSIADPRTEPTMQAQVQAQAGCGCTIM